MEAGSLKKIFYTLSQDLLQRSEFDLSEALVDGAIMLVRQDDSYLILASNEPHDTWQISTALVFLQIAFTSLEAP